MSRAAAVIRPARGSRGMRFSHRELRAHRELARIELGLVAGVATVAVVAFTAPTPSIGLAAIGGLGLAGGWVVHRGSRLGREFDGDLGTVHAAIDRPAGPCGAEVRNTVRPGDPLADRRRPSPHRRPGRPVGGPLPSP